MLIASRVHPTTATPVVGKVEESSRWVEPAATIGSLRQVSTRPRAPSRAAMRTVTGRMVTAAQRNRPTPCVQE